MKSIEIFQFLHSIPLCNITFPRIFHVLTGHLPNMFKTSCHLVITSVRTGNFGRYIIVVFIEKYISVVPAAGILAIALEKRSYAVQLFPVPMCLVSIFLEI